MKICHITSVHIPFDTRIFYKECKSLARAGYDVHLVAKHDRDEVIDGISIHAVPVRQSKIKRMICTTWDVYKKALQIDSETYHFHDPELIFIGILLKIRGKKVLYDVHEDYPNYICYKDTIPRLFRKPAAWITGIIEKYSAGFFDTIVTVTPKTYTRFKAYNENTVEVCNFPCLDELSSGIDENPWENRSDSVTYVGSLTLDRGIKEMVQAVGLAQKKKPVKFILGGSFPTDSVENNIKSMPEFNFVDYRGFMSREDVAKALSEVKAGIVFTYPNSHHKNTYMTKLFEYMSAGVPVIASDFPLWRKIVDGAHCGVLVEPMNIEALADAIVFMLENPEKAREMGKNGRRAIEEKYTWENETIKLLSVYKDLTEQR